MVPIDGRRMRYVGQSTKITVTKFEVSIFIRSRDRSREPKLKKWVTWYNAVWYSKDATGRATAPPSSLLAVPNVTAHPSTASVPITVLLYYGPLL